MSRRPPRPTRPDTLCPVTTLVRSAVSWTDSRSGAWSARANQARADAYDGPGVNPGQAPSLDGVTLAELVDAAAGIHELVLTGVERPEEHQSELQSLMRISYAVLCLTKKINQHKPQTDTPTPT